MKNTIKFLGIIAIVAIIGFSFAACGDGNDTVGGGTAPTITTTELPGGTVNVAYTQTTLTASGDATITWSLDGGTTLPVGLDLAATGVISGTPTAEGTFSFTVKATNAAGSGTKELSITIASAGGGGTAPTITTDARLPGGTVNVAYTQTTLTASGDATITWSLDGGTTLPAGLDLAATGVISGMPTAAGTLSFTVKATNDAGDDTKELSITITKIFSDSGTDFEMAWMNSGTFTMGSPTSEEYRTTSNETQHSVTLTKGFYMSIYPVTQAQYEAVMGSNPSAHRVGGSRASYLGEITDTTNFPVDTITWYNALVFCNKLSILEGLTPAYSIKNSTDPADWGSVPGSSNSDWYAAVFIENSTGYRLPTDAQWEYACRAGTTTAFNTGNTISDNTGWYSANSGNRTHSVGEKPANAWGLYDMHGNVEEWCWDRYDHNYGGEAGASATDPTGADSGGNRVARGGSWYASWTFHRSAYRDSTPPYYATNNTYGLRIVRPAE